jgi:plasmid stabilization system protein ParE
LALHKVNWQPSAKNQFSTILNYFSQTNKNNDYSTELLASVKEVTFNLSVFPEFGKATDYENVRELILFDYSIFYYYEGVSIDIVLFWDNRRNPDLLEIELLKLL